MRLQAQNQIRKEPIQSSYQVLTENPVNSVNLLILVVMWMTATFDYYVISHELKLMKTDVYMTTMISAFTDGFAYIVTYLTFKKIGLSQASFRAFAFGSISVIALMGFLYAYHGSD
jgi:hypothetical protein